METTDYTHLSDDSVDDILRRLGIVSNPPQPQRQPEPEMPMPFGDVVAAEPNTSTVTESEPEFRLYVGDGIVAQIEAPETVIHVDSDSIINGIVGNTPAPNIQEEPQQQQPEERSLPKIVVRREYYDNVFMSRFIGASWAQSLVAQEVLIAGMGGIGRF